MCSTVVGTLDRGTKRDQQESVYIHTYLLFFFFSKIVQPSKRFVPGLSGNPGTVVGVNNTTVVLVLVQNTDS